MNKNNELIMDCIKERRSIRSYYPDEVPKKLLDKIIECGLYSASGMGRQSAIILCITDKKLRDRLSKMNAEIMGREDIDPFYGAPCVFVVLADKNIPTAIYDGSLALGNMMLASHALGLGSCWIHRAKEEFESDEGKQILSELGVNGDYVGVGHLIVGYRSGETPEAKERREGRVFRV